MVVVQRQHLINDGVPSETDGSASKTNGGLINNGVPTESNRLVPNINGDCAVSAFVK